MNTHSFRAWSFLVALSAILAACATSGTPVASTSPAVATPDESAWGFFVDSGDGGDDIWTPGCHYKCSDRACAGEREFWGGDSCTGRNLHEWTNASPHAAGSDIQAYDCATECRQKGHVTGRCVRVESACEDAYPSSRCECDG